MELKDNLKGKLKEFEALVEEINGLLEELIDEPEKEKDKIELLDEYMKSLDERLFVERCHDGDVSLNFSAEHDIGWHLGYIDVQKGKFIQVEQGFAPEDLFNELLKYKYAFKGKYDELFKGEE